MLKTLNNTANSKHTSPPVTTPRYRGQTRGRGTGGEGKGGEGARVRRMRRGLIIHSWYLWYCVTSPVLCDVTCTV